MLAPRTRPLSSLWGSTAPSGWGGALHMLAGYARALSREQAPGINPNPSP